MVKGKKTVARAPKKSRKERAQTGSEVTAQIEAGRRFMAKYRDTFKVLAK